MTAGGVWINYMPGRLTTWRGDAASGLVVLVPLLVIAYVVIWIYSVLASFPVLNAVQPPIVRVAIVLAGFAGLVLVTGSLMRTTTGTIVEATLDTLVNRIPGLRIVYNASKMGIETVVDGTDHLRTPVRVETWPGMYMTGFKTGNRTSDGREVVFIPTAPNITTGFVVELETEDVTELDESTEDALIRIISCGFGEAPQPDALNEDDRSSNAPSPTTTD
jgi:uncharacterized membrane protein